MKVTYTVDIPDHVKTDVDSLYYLLNDALAEFARRREPVWMYVKARYPEGYQGQPKHNPMKIAQVQHRITLATLLRRGEFKIENHEKKRKS